MKKFRKLITLLMLVLSMTTVFFPTGALAASKTYKGTGSQTYTITTKKKDSTLTITRKKGKVRYRLTTWSKYKNGSCHGTFTITIVGGGKTQKVHLGNWQDDAKVTLKKNSTYTVTITCTGFDLMPGRDFTWKTAPQCKLKVNNSAKIK